MSFANLLALYPDAEAPVYLTGPREDTFPGHDPLIRTLAIAINVGAWWDSDVQRTEALLPIAPLIVSAAVGEEIMNRRLVMFVDRYFRRLLPLVLQATEIPDLAACARDLEALPAIVDASTARLAGPILARALDLARARARALARALDRARVIYSCSWSTYCLET
jgi:hypothetical protein